MDQPLKLECCETRKKRRTPMFPKNEKKEKRDDGDDVDDEGTDDSTAASSHNDDEGTDISTLAANSKNENDGVRESTAILPSPRRQFIQALHHIAVVVSVTTIILKGPTFWPSTFMVLFWIVYADMYSGILHCVLDDKRVLKMPVLAPVAKGFQDHHDYPIESTWDKGLYVLMGDTVRIQWLTCITALLFSRWNYATFQLVLLKLLSCAYGTQFGHYYAHAPKRAPWPIIALQKVHLLLPPRHHWQHHKAPYTCNFGIVNGLSNYILNPILHPSRYWFEPTFACWAFLTAFDVALVERFTNIAY